MGPTLTLELRPKRSNPRSPTLILEPRSRKSNLKFPTLTLEPRSKKSNPRSPTLISVPRSRKSNPRFLMLILVQKCKKSSENLAENPAKKEDKRGNPNINRLLSILNNGPLLKFVYSEKARKILRKSELYSTRAVIS